MRGVLFLCSGNACRSQMAEGFARRLAPPGVLVWSAGTEPAGLDPRAVRVMAELGCDISAQRSKALAAIPLETVDTVVTLCGDAAERCPVWPGAPRRIHWGLADPARAVGGAEEVLRAFRTVRDEIERRVRALLGPEASDLPEPAGPSRAP